MLRRALVWLTGHGYDRSSAINNLHHKLAFRLHKLLPLFGIRGVQRIDVPGLAGKWMYVRAEDGGVAHQLIMYKQYEPFESEIIRGELKPGMVVYNVGANLGYYVLLASNAVLPSGRVMAFEPAESNLELLYRTQQENHLTNVNLFGCAIGAEDGAAVLALSGSNSGDHQLREAADRDVVKVLVRSLDTLISRGIPAPDVIIMDVQGSELDVLRGMEKLLASGKPHVIFTEFWPEGLNTRHPNGAQEFLDTLTRAGFQLSLIDEKRRTVKETTTDALLRETVGFEERNLLCKRVQKSPEGTVQE